LKVHDSFCDSVLKPFDPRDLRFRLQVRLATKGAWLEVTLDRPSALNALNADMVDAITAAYRSLVQTDSPVRGILLQGGGDRVRIRLLFEHTFDFLQTCAC
jgi:hypothetical protein